MNIILKTAAFAAMAFGLSAMPALAGKPGAPNFTVSAKDRAASDAWWTERKDRKAQRKMAACMKMPNCKDRQAMPDVSPSNS